MPTENETPIEQALSRFLDGEPEPEDGALLAEAMAKDDPFAQEVRRLLVLDDLLHQAAQPDEAAFTDALRIRLAAEAEAASFIQAVRNRLGPPAADAAKASPTTDLPKGESSVAWRLSRRRRLLLVLGAAAVVLLSAGITWWLVHTPAGFESKSEGSADVAWLINAQDCRWAEGGAASGYMGAGKVLQLEQGLAELGFPGDAHVVLQGPATLEIRSGTSVRLVRGRLAARVPEAARGFEVLSSKGKVVDLGTEFGMSVEEDGSAQVHVFDGEVQARPAEAASGDFVRVREQQSARISLNGVSFEEGGPGPQHFVRKIVPHQLVVPRTLALDFRRAVDGTLPDAAGLGTGLTHRLPGTGEGLPAHDPNLLLNQEAGRLELTTTKNDLNEQYKLAQGEYPGIRLSDLGFTGTEDFSVTALIPNIPTLETVDQFGLYAGLKSDQNIRGGLLRPGDRPGEGPSRQFFVHNNGGRDSHLYMVGLVSIGTDLRLTLQRLGGKYSLTIENQTSGESSTLAVRHPEFLDGARELYVGLFGATPWRDKPRTFFVKEFQVTVWTQTPDAGPLAPEKKRQE